MPAANQRTTVPLFDIHGGARPPADAVEIYVETPMTVGILYSSTRENGDIEIADGVFELCLHALDRAMPYLQREAGYVKVGQHHRLLRGRSVGKFLPGQLETTTAAEVYADQHTDVARIHQHVYLGRSARCDEDGQHWPVDLDGVKAALPGVHALYRSELKVLLTQALDVEWSTLDDGRVEITHPPIHQFLGGYPHRVTCRGPFRAGLRWNLEELVAAPARRDAV